MLFGSPNSFLLFTSHRRVFESDEFHIVDDVMGDSEFLKVDFVHCAIDDVLIFAS